MLITLIALLLAQDATIVASRMFGCSGRFTADLTEQRLIEIYGTQNVRPGDIYVGEGFTEPGATVFPDSAADRIEVVWSDGKKRAAPRFVRVKEKFTRWRTVDGVSIGTDLKTIERINRRPFRLRGFGWDNSGALSSWSGGRLDQQDTPGCRVSLRALPPGEGPWPGVWEQVVGTAEFSSGHPAMQQLNPRVTELFLVFPKKD